MIDDLRRMIYFNDGEEVVQDDFNNAQSAILARMYDQIVAAQLPALNKDPQFGVGLGSNPENYAFALSGSSAYFRKGSTNNSILIAPGVLLQYLAGAATPDFPLWAAWESDGTHEFALTNGSGTNPRVDILQMKIEWYQTGATSRAVRQVGAKAIIDFGTITTNFNSVYRARVAGLSGDNISVQMVKRTSGVGVTYIENGNAIVIQYQDGVSTCATVDAAVVASSTLLDIQSAGTPATVLHDPADTHAAVHLTGGSDDIIVATTPTKTWRTKATINVKTGTPSATPTVPDPDAGFVMLCCVMIPTSFAWGTTWSVADVAGTPVLFDHRIPMGLRTIRCRAPNAQYDTGKFTVDTLRSQLTCSTLNGFIFFPCDAGEQVGRIVGIRMAAGLAAGEVIDAFSEYEGDGALTNALGTPMNGLGLGNLDGAVAADRIDFLNPSTGTLEAFDASVGRTVHIARNSRNQGACMWTNGLRGAYAQYFSGDTGSDHHTTTTYGFSVGCKTTHVGSVFKDVTFFIAGG